MSITVPVLDCGFIWSPVADLFGQESADWYVTRGKQAGLFLRELGNPRWLEFSVWRLKGLDPRAVPAGLLDALKKRWAVLVEAAGEDADTAWLDGMDPSRPFRWDGDD